MKKSLIILVTAICNIHCFAQLPSYLPTNGLVAWYPFNGNAKDSSGNNYNGVVHGATLIKDRFGNLKSAYKFSGTQYIEVPFTDPFVAQSHTISCWMKSNQTKLGRLIVLPTALLVGGGDQHFAININLDSSFASILFDDVAHPGHAGVWAESTDNVNDNNWHHIAGIIDSTNHQLRIYNDGKLEKTVAYDGGPSTYATDFLQFGRYGSADNNEDYIGVLDDIAIYNRVLDSSEIHQLYCSCVLPSATITNKSILEGNTGTKQLKFPVTLNSAYADTVKIKYKTKNNTATAGSDYIAKQGTLIFNPGQTTKNIIVTINGDTQQEANEKFFVLLSQPQNTIIADDTAIGTIRNDDTVAFARAEIEQQYQVTAGQHLMSITPNPTKGKFIINLPEDTNNDAAGMIEIVNLQGQVIQKETIPIHSKIKAITLPSGIAVGMYLVHFKIYNKMYETKLIYQP